MKKTLLSTILAAGFAFGLTSATAQDVKTDAPKAEAGRDAQGKDCNGLTGRKLELCLKHGREMSESQPNQGAGAREQTGQTAVDPQRDVTNPVGQGEGQKTPGTQGTQGGPDDSAAAGTKPGEQKEGTTTTPGSEGTQAGPRDDSAVQDAKPQKKPKAQ
jgi:hypothetical protein